MKTISLKLPETMDAHLTAAAEQAGTTKSEITRQALEAFFKNGRKSTRTPSAYDLAKDLIGKFRGGPGDLSTNPKHMLGYGK